MRNRGSPGQAYVSTFPCQVLFVRLRRRLISPISGRVSSPHQSGFSQILPSQAEPDVGAAAARILRESNTTVRQELSGLDPPDRIFDQLAEFVTLLVGNLCMQVLHFDQPLADEDDLGHFRDASDP